MLLLPLENVKQSPKYHPEGDALYHCLQVFELARDERPYDEEFLLAALLARRRQGDRPGRPRRRRRWQALDGLITERTALADRASHGGPGLPRRHPRRPGPRPAPGLRMSSTT